MENELEERQEEIIKRKQRIKDWLKDHQNLILALILILALSIRLYYFFLTKNQPIWWDEGDYVTGAKVIGQNLNINYRWEPHRPFFLMLFFGSLFWVGGGEMIMRFSMLIFSIFGVYLTYLIGKELYGKKVGLIASFCMSVFWLHLFFTNRFLTSLPATTFFLAGVYFFWKGYIKKEGNKYIWLTGLFLGLSFLTRLASGLALAIIVLFMFLRDWFSILKSKKFWVIFVVTILIFMPFILFIQFAPQESSFTEIIDIKDRLTGLRGPKGVLSYIALFPTYLGWPFLILFAFGLYIFINPILGIDLFIKKKKRFDKELLLFLWIFIYIIYFGAFTKVLTEPRYLMYIFPAVFIILGLALIRLYEMIKKHNKAIAIFFVIFILAIGGYFQLKHADAIINLKKDSYLQVKQAALWMKENSGTDDVIFSASHLQTQYYAERSVYRYKHIKDEDDFEEQLEELKPKYITVSAFERHPEWLFNYPAEHPDKLEPVQAYFADVQKQQPLLVVYEVK